MSGSGPIYEYQLELTAKLEQVMRERDEALKRLNATVERWGATERERDEARVEVERLREALRDVAERQREACAVVVERNVDNLMLRKGLAEDVRATPLVTED